MNFFSFSGIIVFASVLGVSSAIRWYQCESSGYTIDEKIGCHKVYNSSEVKTWEQAQEVCKENGANLAVLKSKAEAEFFVNVMDDTNVYWAWIGAREKNGKWTTINGECLKSAGYNRWLHKKDACSPEVNKCVVLVSGYQEPGLMPVSCDLGLHMFICRK